jgi:hypothetical protein
MLSFTMTPFSSQSAFVKRSKRILRLRQAAATLRSTIHLITYRRINTTISMDSLGLSWPSIDWPAPTYHLLATTSHIPRSLRGPLIRSIRMKSRLTFSPSLTSSSSSSMSFRAGCSTKLYMGLFMPSTMRTVNWTKNYQRALTFTLTVGVVAVTINLPNFKRTPSGYI